MDQVAVRPAMPWWLALARGGVAVIVGLVIATQPGDDTVPRLIVLMGAFWLLGGALDLVDLVIDGYRWGWKLLSASAGVLAGFVALRHPLWSTLVAPATLLVTLGLLGIAIGAMSLLRAFVGGGRGAAVAGLQDLVLGLLVLLNALADVVWAVALWAIACGTFTVVTAMRGRMAETTEPSGY